MRQVDRLSMIAVCVCVCVLLTAANTVSAQVLFVDDDAPSGGDGQSWSAAYAHLQDALTAARQPRSGITEIRIAQGEYFPDRDAVNPTGTGDRFVSFELYSGLTLRGGYAGIGAADPDANDPLAHVSVLSGDIGIIDSEVVVAISDATGVMLTGVVIRDAVDSGIDVVNTNAAFAQCSFLENQDHGIRFEGSDATFEACTFRENIASSSSEDGGAVSLESSEAVFQACTFVDNKSEDDGGAIFAIYSNLEIENCNFMLTQNLPAADGGGGFVHSQLGSFSASNCTFSSDNVLFIAAASGGAVSISQPATPPSIVNCVFFRMRCQQSGGAIQIGSYSDSLASALISDCLFTECAAAVQMPIGPSHSGFGGAISNGGRLLVLDCTFEGNAAGLGGAIQVFQGQASVINCDFSDNIASSGGVARIAGNGASCLFRQCLFLDNSAFNFGGAMVAESTAQVFVEQSSFLCNRAVSGGAVGVIGSGPSVSVVNSRFIGNSAQPLIASQQANGGVLRVSGAGSSASLANCTIVFNTAEDGGGLAEVSSHGDVVVNNSILWNNSDSQGSNEDSLIAIDSPESHFKVSYSIISGMTGSLGGAGNLGASPAFVDGPNGGVDGFGDDPDTLGVDESLNDDYGDLQLTVGSSAIDAGWNNALRQDVYDMDDDDDVNEFVPFDLGESPRFAQVNAIADTGCGHGALVDIGAYEFQGVPAQPTYGDVTGNMTVDVFDVVAILDAWGDCSDDCCLDDINADGTIDVFDLLLALTEWS